MANENSYSIKHKRQTDKDRADNIHRYTFKYKGKQYTCCIDYNNNVTFSDELPDKIKKIITGKLIYNLDINGLRI